MSSSAKTILAIVVVGLIAVVAYLALTKPDNRNGFEKVGDAVSELPNGVDNAARELEDRTPGEKIVDETKDAVNAQ